MSGNHCIREANYEDIPRLIYMLKILFSIEKDFSVDVNKQKNGLELMLLDPCRTIMIAEVNGLVIGMCTAQIIISTAEGGHAALIEDMVIAEGYRGKGIGKALLNSIQSWAIGKGAKRLQLLADCNNLPALFFYRKLGWNTTQLVALHKKMNT